MAGELLDAMKRFLFGPPLCPTCGLLPAEALSIECDCPFAAEAADRRAHQEDRS